MAWEATLTNKDGESVLFRGEKLNVVLRSVNNSLPPNHQIACGDDAPPVESTHVFLDSGYTVKVFYVPASPKSTPPKRVRTEQPAPTKTAVVSVCAARVDVEDIGTYSCATIGIAGMRFTSVSGCSFRAKEERFDAELIPICSALQTFVGQKLPGVAIHAFMTEYAFQHYSKPDAHGVFHKQLKTVVEVLESAGAKVFLMVAAPESSNMVALRCLVAQHTHDRLHEAIPYVLAEIQ